MSKGKGKQKSKSIIAKAQDGWTPFIQTLPAPKPPEIIAKMTPEALINFNEQMQEFITGVSTMWQNNRYTVIMKVLDESLTHLSIRRNTRSAAHDWRHFQRIKNELCGPEREAVELYPAESRLIDGANQYHLWVFAPDIVLPFGFAPTPELQHDINVGMDANEIGGKQRPKD